MVVVVPSNFLHSDKICFLQEVGRMQIYTNIFSHVLPRVSVFGFYTIKLKPIAETD